MKRRTGLESTRDWMRSWVGPPLPGSSESDILSGVKDDVVAVMDCAVRCCVVATAAVAAEGEKAAVHDADDRRAVAKRIGRIMMAAWSNNIYGKGNSYRIEYLLFVSSCVVIVECVSSFWRGLAQRHTTHTQQKDRKRAP